MLYQGRLPLGPLAVVGLLFILLPNTLEAFEADAETQEATSPRLVRRNFLRFGKRSVSNDDHDHGLSWGKRESDNGPGEVFEQTVVGVHPHRSAPRSFLRFGKRSFIQPAMSRPIQGTEIDSNADTEAEQEGDSYNADYIPFTTEELEAMLLKKRADNFLRFGKRFIPKELRDKLALLALAEDGMDKRSKDFLRFG